MENFVVIQAIELTSNVSPTGSQAVGGITPNNNDLVILGAQTVSGQNGLYRVNLSGAWIFLITLSQTPISTTYGILRGSHINAFVTIQKSGINNVYKVVNSFPNLEDRIAVGQLPNGGVNGNSQLIQTTSNGKYPGLDVGTNALALNPLTDAQDTLNNILNSISGGTAPITTVGVGGQYATVNGALLAGQNTLLIIGDATETADIVLNANTTIIGFNTNALWDLGDHQFIHNADNLNLTLDLKNTLKWSPTTPKALINGNSKTGATLNRKSLVLDGSDATANDCPLYSEMGLVTADGVTEIQLPDKSGWGIDFASNVVVYEMGLLIFFNTATAGTNIHHLIINGNDSQTINEIAMIGNCSETLPLISSQSLNINKFIFLKIGSTENIVLEIGGEFNGFEVPFGGEATINIIEDNSQIANCDSIGSIIDIQSHDGIKIINSTINSVINSNATTTLELVKFNGNNLPRNDNILTNADIFIEQSTTPATPIATQLKLYAKSNRNLYTLDSDGVEQQLGGLAESLYPYPFKIPVTLVLTTPVGIYEGEITQGDYTATTGDRILLTAESDPAKNLIWVIGEPSAFTWEIAPDSQTVIQIDKGVVYATQGTNVGKYYYATATAFGLQSIGSVDVTGTGPQSIALSTEQPNYKNAYVTNYNSAFINQYSIQPDGTLTPMVPDGVSTPPNTTDVVITKNHLRYVYVLCANNPSNGKVAMFSRNLSTGALTALSPATIDVGTDARQLVLSPDDDFLYVTNGGDNTISIFSRDSLTGLLSVVGSPVATDVSPSGIAITNDGQWLYVTNQITNTILVYSRDIGTGLLTNLPAFTISTNLNNALNIAISDDDAYMYVVNNGNDTLNIYSINDSTGELTLVGSPLTVGSNPINLALSIDQEILYLTNGSNLLSIYVRDPITGTLAFVEDVNTNTGPSGVAVSPNHVYVVNFNDANVIAYDVENNLNNAPSDVEWEEIRKPQRLNEYAVGYSDGYTLSAPLGGLTTTIDTGIEYLTNAPIAVDDPSQLQYALAETGKYEVELDCIATVIVAGFQVLIQPAMVVSGAGNTLLSDIPITPVISVLGVTPVAIRNYVEVDSVAHGPVILNPTFSTTGEMEVEFSKITYKITKIS